MFQLRLGGGGRFFYSLKFIPCRYSQPRLRTRTAPGFAAFGARFSRTWRVMGKEGKAGPVSCSAPPDAKQTSREQSFGVHLWRFCTIRAARANNDPGSFTSRPELEPHAPGECCSAQRGAAAALTRPRRAVPRRVLRALCQHEHPNLARGSGAAPRPAASCTLVLPLAPAPGAAGPLQCSLLLPAPRRSLFVSCVLTGALLFSSARFPGNTLHILLLE